MKPNFLSPIHSSTPAELIPSPWAVWIAELRKEQEGKFNKAPRSPASGKKIGANQPEKFGTFDEAKIAFELGSYTGVGVLLHGTGIVGVDIDDYAKVFALRPEVKQWVNQAIKRGAYCEYSPSGKGLRLFLIGTLPVGGRKSDGLEIYADKRFLTVTGHTIPSNRKGISNHLTHDQELIDEFLYLFPNKKNHSATDPNSLGIQLRTGSLNRTDIPTPLQKKLPELFSTVPLLVKEKWRDLYNGDISAYEDDESRADLAMAGYLAREGCTADEIDQIMRTSALYRGKWDTSRGKSTWLHNTIALAWNHKI